MKYLSLLAFVSIFFITSCNSNAQNTSEQSAHAVKVSNVPYQDANAAQFKTLMNEENAVILDVRTPQETALGMIDGAIQLNLQDRNFVEGLNKLDKNKTYLVYCRSGRRSVVASKVMAQNGFGSIYNLVGGYNRWVRQ